MFPANHDGLPNTIFTYMNQIAQSARHLPIYEKRAEIISALKDHQVIVIAGQTGSGKTTQLPLFCLEAGRGRRGRRIGCTQPRRIAATSIAARVAAQVGCEVGGRVGYKIRFAARESPQTAIKFMTDGILLAEVEHDREFRQYDTIIIDEAHERSLNIDFLLGYLRKLLPRRPDLKVIVSSATIDAEGFSKSFNDAPVIEVSGRLFPIEVLYRSDNAEEDEDERVSYVEDAARAAEDILDMYGPGDMLMFMPTERDIRETCDKLGQLSLRRGISVLPLFSRLTRAEQDAIFNPGGNPRIVVCTNIAETSITVPNIRYVVDTGLARISRYAPRLRTNRLPIEPISRASADQRKGRCGRVQEGVCVRLYSEDDYKQREEFTLPEIKRANLAGVILTMAAHNLGTIEDFPFIEPPSKQAISEGYAQLKELDALDRERKLTRMGREMAKLPFDPHISRMIIAAKQEKALREVKIIAAALSIVDPRERPFDKQKEADAVHARFIDRTSDFLTYINLWDAYQQEWDKLKTQGRIRRFCKDNFLSYTRMREWHDVHQQLDETLSHMKNYPRNDAKASSDAIHRSLLTGLLANCAYLDKTGKYKATGGRDVLIFPGSTLAKKKCEWVMCHEIVETSRVFARGVAPINPQWLEELAADFCKHTFETPFFDIETGCVRATERVTFMGLPLAVKKNALYSKADPEAATDIFIHEGLVNEALVGSHKFYTHNKEVKKKILLLEDKLRSKTYYSGDDAIFDFYKERLPLVASVHDLNRAIKDKGSDKFLFMREEEILNASVPNVAEHFPDHVNIGNRNFALRYAFEPGADHDGVTLALPQKVIPFIEKETLGWLLPALWPDRIKDLLQQLPRGQRKTFIPMNESSAKLAAALDPAYGSFASALSKAVKDLYGIYIDPSLLEPDRAIAHLDLKIEVRDDDNNIVAKGRSGEVFSQMKGTVDDNSTADKTDSPWAGAFASYRKSGLTKWPEDDLSVPMDIGSPQKGGLPIRGYPALIPNETGSDMSVDLVLFPSKPKSDIAHRCGVRLLLELALVKDLAWTERDISFSSQIKVMCSPFGTGDQFKEKLYGMICDSALDFDIAPRSEEKFNQLIAATKESLRGIGFKVLSLFEESLRIFTDDVSRLSSAKKKLAADLAKELADDLNGFFADILKNKITLDIFMQYPRYLKVFAVIIEKAACEPFKYRQKKAEIRQYRSIHNDLRKKNVPEENRHTYHRLLKEFLMMIREYEVNTFAQHIRTLYPISEKRLDKKVEEIKKLTS
ncbi:MAG: ATP-dependent RNA helicase HrpA [Chitinispirillia bacterium]|nr:ATP-dependent RNA helicase HrpA [Chitinispirillia bacterium]MCL2267971.1 ATP-dependent RNA helicase HrpA [Chitinispirillia bacterium]